MDYCGWCGEDTDLEHGYCVAPLLEQIEQDQAAEFTIVEHRGEIRRYVKSIVPVVADV